MPFLRIVVAEQTFETELPADAVRVGTAPVCDLTLACDGVAAEHCVLEPMPSGEWRLKDLGSGHGTRVNGADVRQVALKPGDLIELGAASIHFDAPALQPAAAPARPAPSAAPARIDGGPSEASAPVAPAPPAPVPSVAAGSLGSPRGSAGRKLVLGALALALVGGVLVAIGLTGKGDGGEGDARARRDLEAAIGLYRAHDYLGARQALSDLEQRVRAGDVARQAGTYLASVNQALSQAEGELDGWVTRALDFDLSLASSRQAVFLEEHGQGFAARVETALTRVRTEQQRWRQLELARVAEEVEPLLGSSHYKQARARWTRAQATAPPGIDLGPDVARQLAALDAAAEFSAAQLQEHALTAVRLRGPRVGAEILGAAIEHYEGTAVHGALAERLATLEREAVALQPAVVPGAPSTSPGALPGAGPSVPPSSTAPVGPSTPATAELVKRLEADVAKAVSERAFARAVDLLDQALASVGEGPAKQALTERRGDLALARNGLDALAGAVTADAKRFGRLELGERLVATPLSADREGLACAIQGGSTRVRWATMNLAMLVMLCERMEPGVQDALSVASLLHEVKAAEAYERMLVRAGEGGSEASTLFRLLARWRGEAPPADGYVAYEGRYVTPQARERLILESRIRGGLDRLAAARSAPQRRAVVDELLALGEAARGPLTDALQQRRLALVNELLHDKAFTSGRTRQRLWDLLQTRRAHALALIEDAAAYPYPNPNHMGQAEVERRVDEVREVWERPFRLVAEMDDGVKAALDVVIEVDEALSKVDPGYKPDLGELEAAASKAVDMPGYAPPGQAASLREYSLRVLAFNERVATSAGREEKDNVRAVNEYRMMMGRGAVKINERLVRAARGHSRHMNVNGYFAHDAPARFPEVANPGLRARRQGYGGGVGENIAWGTPSGRDAFNAWFGSSGHHRNMLSRGWTEMGAGRSAPSHWTQLFGAAGGRGLSEPDALPAPTAEVAPDPEPAAPERPAGPITPRLPDEAPPGGAPDVPDPDMPGEGTPPGG